MTRCVFCEEEIQPGTRAASIAGGMFPREEPDIFMIDAEVLVESHAHLDCLVALVRESRRPIAASRKGDTG